MSGKISDKRREEFCFHYVMTGDVAEAAIHAGFDRDTALRDGINCLRRKSCQRKISELRRLFCGSGSVAAGLRRLAFGSCRDAVTLSFYEELPPDHVLERMDLFNVAEIKRGRNGFEIKLFDRIRALEKLNELESAYESRDRAQELMDALMGSSKESDGNEDN